MDAGGRAMQEQLPRRIKSSSYIPLIQPSPLEKGSRTCVDIYDSSAEYLANQGGILVMAAELLKVLS